MKHTIDFDLEKTRDHFYPMFTTVKTRSPRRAIPQMPITEKSTMTLGWLLVVVVVLETELLTEIDDPTLENNEVTETLTDPTSVTREVLTGT